MRGLKYGKQVLFVGRTIELSASYSEWVEAATKALDAYPKLLALKAELKTAQVSCDNNETVAGALNAETIGKVLEILQDLPT